jgi:hypothetical protein
MTNRGACAVGSSGLAKKAVTGFVSCQPCTRDRARPALPSALLVPHLNLSSLFGIRPARRIATLVNHWQLISAGTECRQGQSEKIACARISQQTSNDPPANTRRKLVTASNANMILSSMAYTDNLAPLSMSFLVEECVQGRRLGPRPPQTEASCTFPPVHQWRQHF